MLRTKLRSEHDANLQAHAQLKIKILEIDDVQQLLTKVVACPSPFLVKYRNFFRDYGLDLGRGKGFSSPPLFPPFFLAHPGGEIKLKHIPPDLFADKGAIRGGAAITCSSSRGACTCHTETRCLASSVGHDRLKADDHRGAQDGRFAGCQSAGEYNVGL